MEAIGQLAGGVAHDFNNILAAMMMQADLASQTDGIPEEASHYLDDLKGSAERAANLTRQLLAFSRRQVMQPRDVDLNVIVTGLARMLQRTVGEDVRLQLNLASRPLGTHADAGMLDQVVLNLVVNARDAMPDGGCLYLETLEKTLVSGEADTVTHLATGRYVCLRVTDTGTGIPPDVLAHIFEPFFTTKEPGKGTGLGLSTVFGIVKQHNGSIAVESEPGKGTSFQIYLPALTGAVRTAAELDAVAKPRGGTETILLVEDDSAVRLLSGVLLERHGYRVLMARDGHEAQRVWEEHRSSIKLLLTDIVMPGGISGRDLAARLRLHDPQLRIIYTSGYSAEIAGRELILQEGQNFLQKPARPKQLLETVRRILDAQLPHS
jgi:CheY-like chemotaxis protein